MNTPLKTVRPSRALLAGWLGLMCAGMGAPAAKADPPDSSARAVRFTDLNLTDPSDAYTLYKRIYAAAEAACAALDDGGIGYEVRHECVARALAGAVLRLDSPRVTAIYQARGSGLGEPSILQVRAAHKPAAQSACTLSRLASEDLIQRMR